MQDRKWRLGTLMCNCDRQVALTTKTSTGCLSVCPSVRHTSHFCPAHISATVAPIHATFCTHTPCLSKHNLHPSILTWPSSSATMRQILAKHIFGHCSDNFCPKITQIGTQYIYTHVINLDLSHIAPPSGCFFSNRWRL